MKTALTKKDKTQKIFNFYEVSKNPGVYKFNDSENLDSIFVSNGSNVLIFNEHGEFTVAGEHTWKLCSFTLCKEKFVWTVEN